MSKSLSKLLFILSLVFVVQSLFLMQVFASETEEATYCEYDDYKGQGCEFNLSSRTCYYCNEKHKLSHNYTKYTYSSNEDQHEVQCSREKNGAQCSATTWYDHTTSSSSYTYKKDDYYHYVSCDVCGRTCEEEYHTISDGTMSSESYHKGTCSDCGATDVYGEHNTSGGFVKYHNATHHYMKCSSCGYKEVDDPHNRSSVLDTSKTDDTYHYYKCKETSCTGHVSEKHTKGTFDSSKTDATYHYYKCAVAGCNGYYKEAHSAGTTVKSSSGDYHYFACKVSGCTGTIEKTHTKGSAFATNADGSKMYDKDYHYYKCAATGCTGYYKESHVGSAEYQPDSIHDHYDYHYTKCKICLQTVAAPHEYDENGSYVANSYDAEKNSHKHIVKCTVCNYKKTRDATNEHKPIIDSNITTVNDVNYAPTTGTYHTVECSKCNLGDKGITEDHAISWGGGAAIQDEGAGCHTCDRCGIKHEHAEALGHPTKGRHYYEFPDEVRVGDISDCLVCGPKGKLTLNLNDVYKEKFDSLPQKGEYTIFGASPAMNEVIIEFDDDLVFTADQWPIDIEGTVWKLDELPTFQRYKHGTFYQHVKKLKSSIADINYETGGNLLQECKQLINGQLVYEGEDLENFQAKMRYYLTQYASYEDYYVDSNIMANEVDKMTQILGKLAMDILKPTHTYLFHKYNNEWYNIMRHNWAKITEIGSPIAGTWIEVKNTDKTFKYKKYVDEELNTLYTIETNPVPTLYYGITKEELKTLPNGHYEVEDDGLLTSGFSGDVIKKRKEYNDESKYPELNETLLFVIGGCDGGGADDLEDPPTTITENYEDIYSRAIVGYRDAEGNVINLGNYSPPSDMLMSLKIWDSGGNNDSATTTECPVDVIWTQGAGYRIKGVYVEPQGPAEKLIGQYELDSNGNIISTTIIGTTEGGTLHVPNEKLSEAMSSSKGKYTEITESSENKIKIAIECKPEYELMGVVIYCEPVEITVQHFDDQSPEAIKTNKNFSIKLPEDTTYSLNTTHFSTKQIPSISKAWWPGYILTGYDIFGADGELIASTRYNSDTTTKYDPTSLNAADAIRYATLTTAVLSSSDPYYTTNPPIYSGPAEVYANEFNYQTLHKAETLGFAQNKTVKFYYAYAIADISHVDYADETLQTVLKTKDGKDLKYDVRLDGDNLIVKSLDTTALNSYEQTNGRRFIIDGTTYYYDLSDYALVQVWIYEQTFNEDGSSGDAVLNKVIAYKDNLPTITDPNVKVVTIDSEEFFNGTLISTSEIINQDLKQEKVASDLIIKFVYKEVNSISVRYVDEDGNDVIPPKRVIIEDDDTADVPVPDISDTQGREFKEYTIEDIQDDPTDDGFDKGDEDDKTDDVIHLDGLPDDNLDMIVVYEKIVDDNSGDVEPTDNETPPYAIIKSNDKDEREYDVEEAVPTDEDLFANVRAEEYILRDYFKENEVTQKFEVQLVKEFHADNDETEDPDDYVRENVNVGSPFEYDFQYKYYGGRDAQLYILEKALIANDVLSGDTGKFEDGKVKLTANWENNKPTLNYDKGGQLSIPTGDDSYDSSTGSKVISVSQDDDVIKIEILVEGIAYSKEDINVAGEIQKYRNGAIDQLLINISHVSGDSLKVETDSGIDDVYLTAIQTPLRTMYDDDIVNKLINAGYYHPDEKAEICTPGCLYTDDGIYIKSDARNGWHKTYALEILYTIHEWATDKNTEVTEFLKEYYDPINSEPFGRIFYESGDAENKINKNNIFVYTPIVNRIDLFEDTTNRTSTNKDNSSADLQAALNIIDGGSDEQSRVLEIEKEFIITIPHDGYHPGCGDRDNPSDGYGFKNYNYNGVVPNDEGKTWVKNERFAKEKLVKFSFDVYLAKYSDDDEEYKVHELLEANKWHEISEIIDDDGKKRGMKLEDYTFVIPSWVKDNESGEITVRVVASNYTRDDYMNDTGVGGNIGRGKKIETIKDGETIVTRYNELNQYIIEEKFNIYIAGSLYDLQVRTSNDPEYEKNLKQALTLARVSRGNKFLPIGQRGQITAYNNGIKLGYSVYFDLKTKGTASENIEIIPKIYYVAEDGSVRDNITLYHEPEEGKVERLTSISFPIEMTMTDTRGDVNNSAFKFELARAIKMIEFFNGVDTNTDNSKEYDELVKIGSLFSNLTLTTANNRLPYNNLEESWKLYGYSSEDKFIEAMIDHINNGFDLTLDKDLKAKLQEYGFVPTASNPLKSNDANNLKTFFRNFNGHWYGEFSLPQTTKVISGDNQEYSEKELLKTGYLVVVFDDVVTTTTEGILNPKYISYDKQEENSQWEKESGGAYDTITLPNGKTARIPYIKSQVNVTLEDGTITQDDTMQGGVIAIYEVSKTRLDDQETGGTH